MSAIGAMINRSKADDKLGKLVPVPDHKPLAELLRYKRPIPEWVIDILAELHDPSEGNELDVSLGVIETSTIKQSLRLIGEVNQRQTSMISNAQKASPLKRRQKL